MRAFLRSLFAIFVCAGSSACDPDVVVPPVGVVEGTVQGKSLKVADGVLLRGGEFLSGGSELDHHSVVVVLTNKEKHCESLSKEFIQKDASDLSFFFHHTDANKWPVVVEPGEYRIYQGVMFPPDEANAKTVSVEWVTANSECKPAFPNARMDPTGGTVKLDFINMAAGQARGTFSLVFGTETVTGSFDVDYCHFTPRDPDVQVCE